MGLQFSCARAISAVSTWGLKHVFRRPAANFPGKVALYVDPKLIANLAPRLDQGSICVVGTNGKTTVTNLLADALEAAGQRVVCNRTGANLDSGVATSLLHAPQSDWGVFECDELWLAKILPHLQSKYVLLLNLFRDQLDRVGEIDRIQDSIVGALQTSPETVLLFNADDPLCAAIAQRAGNRCFGFGIDQDLHLPQNTVADAQMCQACSSMLIYDYLQYGQLGKYACTSCDFARPALSYAATDVQVGAAGLRFTVSRSGAPEQANQQVTAPFSGVYMVYNLLATFMAANLMGVPAAVLQGAIDAFNPQNGRLQTFDVAGRKVLLNLAKNPTGFNQNLKIVAQDPQRKAVAFFINDKEADGHDVSWLWDIDFEELRESGQLVVFAGGIRGNDMQVRLKYAGVDAQVVASAEDLLDRIAQLPTSVNAYVIANYTALPGVRSALTARAGQTPAPSASQSATGAQAPEPTADGVATALAPEPEEVEGAASASGDGEASATADAARRQTAGDPTADAAVSDQTPAAQVAAPSETQPVVIAHLFPDLLNLYGDGGNVRVLEQRLRWRGLPVEVRRINYGQTVDLSQVDLVMMGGGPDREQRLASAELMRMRDDLRAFVDGDGALLAICGGYQILGSEWLLGEEIVEGLGLIDISTRRPGTSANRLIDNIVLQSSIADMPVVGYENHAGRTYLGAGVQPFGKVISQTGHGNNDEDKADGVLCKGIVGTYLHGPLLAKNPQVADYLLRIALAHCAKRTGTQPQQLAPLDDTAEQAANARIR